jgi:hypothetical protein
LLVLPSPALPFSSWLPFSEPFHFTSVVCILCILFFGYLSVLPLYAFISSAYISGSIYLLLILPSLNYSLSFLCVPAISSTLAIVCISLTHTPSYLYVVSGVFSLYLSTHNLCSQHSSIA